MNIQSTCCAKPVEFFLHVQQAMNLGEGSHGGGSGNQQALIMEEMRVASVKASQEEASQA